MLALSVALAATATACRRSKGPAKVGDGEAPPVAVSLVAAQEVKAPRVVTLSGTLTGAEEAEVAAGAAGKVLADQRRARLGREERRGAGEARFARGQRPGGDGGGRRSKGSKAQAAQAKLDCERTEHMFEKGAISKADYDRSPHPVRDHQVVGLVGRGAQVR